MERADCASLLEKELPLQPAWSAQPQVWSWIAAGWRIVQGCNFLSSLLCNELQCRPVPFLTSCRSPSGSGSGTNSQLKPYLTTICNSKQLTWFHKCHWSKFQYIPISECPCLPRYEFESGEKAEKRKRRRGGGEEAGIRHPIFQVSLCICQNGFWCQAYQSLLIYCAAMS